MDTSNQIVIIAQKPKAMGDVHSITKVRFLNLIYSRVCTWLSNLFIQWLISLWPFLETWLYRWAWYLHLRCNILNCLHPQMVLETCIFLLLVVNRPSMRHLGSNYQCSGIVALSTDSFSLAT